MKCYSLGQALKYPLKVRYLSLTDSYIDADLQAALDKMPALEMLHFSSFRIPSDAPFTLNLPKIQSLDINCPIRNKKAIFGLNGFPNLRILTIHGAKVAQEFSIIATMKQLENLTLMECELEEMPPIFKRLKKLKNLALNDNKLTEINNIFNYTPNLKTVILDNNLLKNLPRNIGQLTQLEILSCNNNQLEKLPKALTKCKELRKLRLNNNQLKRLPNWIGELPFLRLLHLDENALKSLPKSLAKCVWLEEVSLANNELKHFPKVIAQQPKLSSLTIAHNQIRRLPADKKAYTRSLRKLNVEHNQLQSLAGVQNWENLVLLNVKSNELKELPAALGRLALLNNLRLEDNLLEHIPATILNEKRERLKIKSSGKTTFEAVIMQQLHHYIHRQEERFLPTFKKNIQTIYQGLLGNTTIWQTFSEAELVVLAELNVKLFQEAIIHELVQRSRNYQPLILPPNAKIGVPKAELGIARVSWQNRLQSADYQIVESYSHADIFPVKKAYEVQQKQTKNNVLCTKYELHACLTKHEKSLFEQPGQAAALDNIMRLLQTKDSVNEAIAYPILMQTQLPRFVIERLLEAESEETINSHYHLSDYMKLHFTWLERFLYQNWQNKEYRSNYAPYFAPKAKGTIMEQCWLKELKR